MKSKGMHRRLYYYYIEQILEAGTDIRAVDIHLNNGLMLGAGTANDWIVEYFIARADSLQARGFDWNHRNADDRNVCNLCENRGAVRSFKVKFTDMKYLGDIEEHVPRTVVSWRHAAGGTSSAGKRPSPDRPLKESRRRRLAARGPESSQLRQQGRGG